MDVLRKVLHTGPFLEGEFDAARGQASATTIQKDRGARPDSSGKQRASIGDIRREGLSAGFPEESLALFGAFAPHASDTVAEI